MRSFSPSFSNTQVAYSFLVRFPSSTLSFSHLLPLFLSACGSHSSLLRARASILALRDDGKEEESRPKLPGASLRSLEHPARGLEWPSSAGFAEIRGARGEGARIAAEESLRGSSHLFIFLCYALSYLIVFFPRARNETV